MPIKPIDTALFFDVMSKRITTLGTSRGLDFGEYAHIQKSMQTRGSSLAEISDLTHDLITACGEASEGHYKDFKEAYTRLLHKYPKMIPEGRKDKDALAFAAGNLADITMTLLLHTRRLGTKDWWQRIISGCTEIELVQLEDLRARICDISTSIDVVPTANRSIAGAKALRSEAGAKADHHGDVGAMARRRAGPEIDPIGTVETGAEDSDGAGRALATPGRRLARRDTAISLDSDGIPCAFSSKKHAKACDSADNDYWSKVSRMMAEEDGPNTMEYILTEIANTSEGVPARKQVMKQIMKKEAAAKKEQAAAKKASYAPKKATGAATATRKKASHDAKKEPKKEQPRGRKAKCEKSKKGAELSAAQITLKEKVKALKHPKYGYCNMVCATGKTYVCYTGKDRKPHLLFEVTDKFTPKHFEVVCQIYKKSVERKLDKSATVALKASYSKG